MELHRKITSLTRDDTVTELDGMLDHAHRVTISWWGQRLVSVDGYRGSVTIDELASKYLRSAPFHRDTESTLQDRLTCDGLWYRVRTLYIDSGAALTNTRVYKFLVPMREFRPWCRTDDPMAVILGEWVSFATKDRIFEFTPTEFKTLWPDAEPLGQSRAIDFSEDSERWTASKEMVESALRA